MEYGVTIIFYLIIGMGIAIALWVSDDSTSLHQKIFQQLTAPFFWPIYLPVLLTNRSTPAATPGTETRPKVIDGMSQLINQVESELETAFASLKGWAENVLTNERDRIAELKMAWYQQADRIRELDQLLESTAKESVTTNGDSLTNTAATPDNQNDFPATENQTRIAIYEQTRRENLSQLKTVRTQLNDNLMSTLAWVRELVTMIHLAKYTGAPASRAEELVRQIASAVEGLTKVEPHASTKASSIVTR
jgi:hypothetical protein